jgi:hypothetical protein
MQIEETFRDKKSHRFGWSFEDARSDSTEGQMIEMIGDGPYELTFPAQSA